MSVQRMASDPYRNSRRPEWEAVDADTADLLDLLADDGSVLPSKAEQWLIYVAALRTVAAMNGGRIPANHLRPAVRGLVAAPRIGAFARRARLEGLIADAGWSISDDTEGGNAGKPCRDFVWTGGAK